MELLAYEKTCLAGLFVLCVLVAPGAILLKLHAIWSVGFVFVRGVVAALALGARKSNQCTHESSCTVVLDTLVIRRHDSLRYHSIVLTVNIRSQIDGELNKTTKLSKRTA